MSEATYTPNKEVCENFPHLIVRQVEEKSGDRKKASFICNITLQLCVSARGCFNTQSEVINIMPTAEIPGCRTNCSVFNKNLKKLKNSH